MQSTVFDARVLNALLQRLSRAILWSRGWRLEGHLPTVPQYVLIAAPHTSNWDFVVMLIMAFAFRAKIFWMGKDSLFRGPFGRLFRWLGGISIDRTQPNGVVSQSIEAFRDNPTLVMAIPPEGTRSKARYWKTGFYHIAAGAGVPIALGFIDYRRRTGGFGPLITPTGGLEADMLKIRAFYAGVTGKNPDLTSNAAFSPESTGVSVDREDEDQAPTGSG